MSKFNTLVSLLVNLVNQAIKANNQESAMLKSIKSIFTSTPVFTVAETIEWNAMLSEAVLEQHEGFSSQEELDWQLLLVEAQLGQAVSLVTPTLLVTSVYFQDSWGGWWMTCNANVTGAEAFGPRGCAVRTAAPVVPVRLEDEGEWEVWIDGDTGTDDSNNECPCQGSVDHCHRCEAPIETCTVCNNDKFVSAKVESPFVCGGCQEETRYHLSMMKTEKEWEERQEKDLLDYLPF